MKYIIGLLFLGFSACNVSASDGVVEVNSSTTKFAAGDEVKTVGFYSNCDGVVTGYYRYKGPTDSTRYSVSFNCPNIGWIKEDAFIAEEYLTLKGNKNGKN